MNPLFFVLLFSSLCLLDALLPLGEGACFFVTRTTSRTALCVKAYDPAEPIGFGNNDVSFLLQSLLKEKDEKFLEVVKEKDEKFHEAMKAKDEKFHAVVKEKEKSEKLYEALLAEKVIMVKKLEVDILQVKGALTCRGVLEFIASCVASHMAVPKKQQMKGYAGILKWGAEQAYRGSQISDITILREAYESSFNKTVDRTEGACGSFYVDLYRELSNAIHGAPWCGPAVKNTFADEEDPRVSVLQYICEKRLGLSLEPPSGVKSADTSSANNTSNSTKE